jgi:hypothetical protein
MNIEIIHNAIEVELVNNEINVVIEETNPVIIELGYVLLSGSDNIPFGTKTSAVDAGRVGEIWIDNDYLYLCVSAGTAGNALWKKIPLMRA